MNKRYKIPYLVGDYKPIYRPTSDIYKGESTELFTQGQRYDEWLINDFSVIKTDRWHIIGITHPRPFDFIDDFDCGPASHIHQAEFQLFHCTNTCDTFAEIFAGNEFTEQEKILYPSDRPNEQPELWAPALMQFNDAYRVVYSPKKIRYADTTDFKNWACGELFTCQDPEARDPFVYYENGLYYLFFTEDTCLKYRTSADMKEWSEEFLLMKSFYPHGWQESPFLIKKFGCYYLFWTIFDDRNGVYDNRTFVFVSETIEGFQMNHAPIAMLPAHAPEIVTDADGKTYLLSVFYPENAVSAVELGWK